MTKNEAKEILINTLSEINSDDQNISCSSEEFTEAMLLAIDVLSEQYDFNDLEEAAKGYMQDEIDSGHDCLEVDTNEPLYYPEAMKHAFIAGAKWNREQMMEKAVEADVMLTLHDKTGDISLHTGYLPKELGIKCDDKVHIIIIKDE